MHLHPTRERATHPKRLKEGGNVGIAYLERAMMPRVVESVHNMELRPDFSGCEGRIKKISPKVITGVTQKRWKGRLNDDNMQMDHQGSEDLSSMLCSG